MRQTYMGRNREGGHRGVKRGEEGWREGRVGKEAETRRGRLIKGVRGRERIRGSEEAKIKITAMCSQKPPGMVMCLA